MKYGMTTEQFEILNKLVIQPLKDQGAKVYIFGSRSRGSHHPYSDIDILYLVEKKLNQGVLSKIKEDIEESRFPFIVDLVDDRDLAKSYRENVMSQIIPL